MKPLYSKKLFIFLGVMLLLLLCLLFYTINLWGNNSRSASGKPCQNIIGNGLFTRCANAPEFNPANLTPVRGVTHVPPKMPVVIDGILHQPEEIQKFNGINLIFYQDERAIEENLLYAFTSQEKFQEFLKHR